MAEQTEFALRPKGWYWIKRYPWSPWEAAYTSHYDNERFLVIGRDLLFKPEIIGPPVEGMPGDDHEN